MPEKDMPFGLYGVIIVVIAIVAALYFMKDSLLSMWQSLLPNKNAPTATQTGTTATGQPIVGSDVKYVNPILCALTGKFCDPNAAQAGGSDDAAVNPNLVGMFAGTDVYQQDNVFTVTPAGQGTTVYCEKDPAVQNAKATMIAAKLNKGLMPTLSEGAWARRCEPKLYDLMGDDLKAAVLASYGVLNSQPTNQGTTQQQGGSLAVSQAQANADANSAAYAGI